MIKFNISKVDRGVYQVAIIHDDNPGSGAHTRIACALQNMRIPAEERFVSGERVVRIYAGRLKGIRLGVPMTINDGDSLPQVSPNPSSPTAADGSGGAERKR